MPLPPLLLERLKRRKIIKVNPQNELSEREEGYTQSHDIESRYQDVEHSAGNNLAQGHEEIIAEDYSDEEEDLKLGTVPGISGGLDIEKSSPETENQLDRESNQGDDCRKSTQVPTESVLGCPNKYNIHHECSQYCVDKYSSITDASPSLEQRKQLALILRTYPISNEWTVVYDPGVKKFYFWNIITNLVSWLPPGMNGFVSPSADHIRRAMKEIERSQNVTGSPESDT